MLPFLLLVSGTVPWSSAWAGSACRGAGTRVVVELEAHQLVLCEAGQVVESFGVRLGHSGVGKSREGDGKTPVGVYPLGLPRVSKRYGLFIPIGYPTDDQRKKGLTGGSIGVHGPDRRARWLGRLVNTFDTSDGCVGLAKDEEMEKISKWIRSTKARTIELR